MSYSEYLDDLAHFYETQVDPKFNEYRTEISALLKEEQSLMDIVRLIGSEVLPEDQKLVIEIARLIRVGFLQQNAYHAEDTYVPLDKQFRMMELILHVYHLTKELIAERVPLEAIKESGVMELVIKVKYDIPNRQLERFDTLTQQIDGMLSALRTQKKEVL